MINGTWTVNPGAGSIESDDFEHDVLLVISGDFDSVDAQYAYAQALCNRLNTNNHLCPCGCGREVCGRCGNETGFPIT